MTGPREPCACARCDEFTTKDRPDLAAQGKGLCQIRERQKAWNDTGCVLYVKAKNIGPREAFIRRQEQRNQKEDTRNQ